MISEIKELVAHVMTSPRSGYLAIIIATVETWWLEWGSSLMSAATSIASLILLVVLIRLHLKNTKKLSLEIKELINKNAK